MACVSKRKSRTFQRTILSYVDSRFDSTTSDCGMDIYHDHAHEGVLPEHYIQHEEQVEQGNVPLVGEHPTDEDHLGDDEEEYIDYIEEHFYGQIVHGEDNQYYVVMDDDTPEFDFEKLNNVRVVLNEDGTKTLLMENTTQKEVMLNDSSVTSTYHDSISQCFGPNDQPHERFTDGGPSHHSKRVKGDDAHLEFDGEHDSFGNDMMDDGRSYGSNKRHSRVYGDYKCPECDQAFVNTARLERHLAVHQIFGSFLCPLCGKTYKYEYNLFYHWRRTCRDMNDLLSYNDRKNMEVTNLRQLVEEIAQKKANIGPLELSLGGGVSAERMGNGGGGGMGPPNHHPHDIHGDAVINETGAPLPAEHVVDDPRHSHYHSLPPHHAGDEEAEEREDSYVTQHHDDSHHVVVGGAGSRHHASMGELGSEKWMDEEGLIFDHDLMHDEDVLMVNEDGQLRSMVDVHGGLVTSGALPVDEPAYIRAAGGRDGDYGEPGGLPPDAGNVYTAIHPLDAEECYISRGTTQAIQCGECFRSFANIARLERHLASAHSSYGAHHCQLCGSRFKYEYNLLYHIRRVCPYAKEMIEEEAREQLPATNLKRLMRTLANQDIVRLPADHISAMTFNHKPDLGDAVIREQMMKSVMPHYRASAGGDAPMVMAPPPTFQSQMKPGFPEGKKCPVCSIIFYGVHILARHMKVAHPAEYDVWAPQLAIEGDEEEEYQGVGRAGAAAANYSNKQAPDDYEQTAAMESYNGAGRPRRYVSRASAQQSRRRIYGDLSTGEEKCDEESSTSTGIQVPRQHLPLRARQPPPAAAGYVRDGVEYDTADIVGDPDVEDYVEGTEDAPHAGNEIMEPPPALHPEPDVDEESHLYSAYNMVYI